MSSAESNKTSQKTPSQDSLSDPRNEDDFDTWEYGTEPLPGDDTWVNLLDKADQQGNPFAEAQWEMEKKMARQEKERNTRHSVDKSQDFIESGMTLITDVESDKYLKSVTRRTKEN
jgi:hypothetical protein